MDAVIQRLTQEAAKDFRALITSSSTHAPSVPETRIQDLEELSDRFNTCCTNLIRQPYGDPNPQRRSKDAPELLDAVKEVLRNISEDLMEVRKHQNECLDRMKIGNINTNESPGDERPEPSVPDEEPLAMIYEDINESITSLMRLTKPLNDNYLLGRPSHANNSVRSKAQSKFLSELRKMFPHTSVSILSRLARSTSDKRSALSTLLSRTQSARLDDDGDEFFCNVYSSLQSVLQGRPNSLLDSLNRDADIPDETSISSLASNDGKETESMTCQLCNKIVPCGSESVLRRHYHQDLEPYICVLQNCPLPHLRYGTRTAWAEHIRSQHGRIWRCCFGCEETFVSRQIFDAHMCDVHHQEFNTAELPGLAEICEKHTLPYSTTTCLFCQEPTINARVYYRHVARHLEDLAPLLFQPLGHQVHKQSLDPSVYDGRSKVSDFPKLSHAQRGSQIGSATGRAPNPTAVSISNDQSSSRSGKGRSASVYPDSASESGSSEDTHLADKLPALEPSCAICAVLPHPECAHEGERLQIAMGQAEDRWGGFQRIKNWVLDQARNHIIRTFVRDKAMRYDAHFGYLNALPYYPLYQYHEGRPPLPPRELQILETQLRAADNDLKMHVDADWRSACLMYPEVLDHYFKLVTIQFPSKRDERSSRSSLLRQTRYLSRALPSNKNPFSPAFGRMPMTTFQTRPEWYSPQNDDAFVPGLTSQSNLPTQIGDDYEAYIRHKTEAQRPLASTSSRAPGSSYHSSLYSAGPSSTYSGSERLPSFHRQPGGPGWSPYPMRPMQGYLYPPAEVEKEDDSMAKEIETLRTLINQQREAIIERERVVAAAEKAKKAEEVAADEAMAKEVEKLREMIKQQEDERLAREEAIAAAEVAKKLKAEQEALKAREIAAAIAATKAEAEKTAEESAKKAKEESDRKLAEVEAAKMELEKKDNSMLEELESLRDLIKRQEATHTAPRSAIGAPEFVEELRNAPKSESKDHTLPGPTVSTSHDLGARDKIQPPSPSMSLSPLQDVVSSESNQQSKRSKAMKFASRILRPR